ncbi:hypothetical protein [Streptomyces sp.]|uniref:hypothetical protein n=1 Tax=Streptomyces sp. TaxID=1931 RepID=UPI002F952144
MSSVYRVLCLSHDPALALTEVEYSRPESAATDIASGIDGHQECDLLIGRYSYPLVEVGCPPATGPERSGQRRCYSHSTTEWVDVAWLRILAAVHQSGTENMRALSGDARLTHWSPERLQRLRYELGIDADEPADQAGASR